MNMKKFFFSFLAFSLCLNLYSRDITYNISEFGIIKNSTQDCSLLFKNAIKMIKANTSRKDKITINFEDGTYNFHASSATEKEYYISNHDQLNPKKVGLALEEWNNLTINGNGANFIFHGRMLPVALVNSKNCTLKNFSIDFVNPNISQVKILNNSNKAGIIVEVAPYVKYRITPDSIFEAYGDNWKIQPQWGIAFEEKTKHLVYNTSDIFIPAKGVFEVSPGILQFPRWKDSRLIPGTVVAMRSWERPTPGIFMDNNKNTFLNNITIHYSEGMGLLAQLCENITLDHFNVSLKGKDDTRYFTSQADATHFSQCKGKILSVNGFYEGMMDDAINVHGTYLKVIKKIDDYTILGKYMHDQAWGFTWGNKGDKVQFVRSKTMDIVKGTNKIAEIISYDKKETKGAKEFLIKFKSPIDKSINMNESYGIENLSWTPKVTFSNNIVRNNRARGALFSTPKKVIVENNFFDHTSGCAILLCGDCNGWYETGACKDVIIRKNRFTNALTNMFQFTNAVISIYPEIPDLENQTTYFHGNKKGAIKIEDNIFETFDIPLLYAKSVNGLIFRNNIIKRNNEYKPFHWNKEEIMLERVINAEIDK